MRGVLVVCLLAACGRLGFDDRDPGGAGDGGTSDTIPIVGRWKTAVTNGDATCAITNTGELWCFGYGPNGNLGNGKVLMQPMARVGTDSDWRAIALGDNVTCGLRTDDTLWCWGTNAREMIPGAPADTLIAAPTLIAGATYQAIGSAYGHACAIQTDGTLICWGEGSSGVLGRGTAPFSAPPAPVSAVGTTRWTRVAVALDNVCGIQTDQSLWCWGSNVFGHVGDGTSTQRRSPVQVGAGTQWTAVATGYTHTCAIEVGGALWCWGNDNYGQLGSGVAGASTPSPRRVTSVPAMSAIALGDAYTCGLALTGEVWCWGVAEHGQLGIKAAFTPQPVLVAPFAREIFSHYDVTCLLDGEDHLLCTGANGFGQTGEPHGGVLEPTQSDTRTDWTAIFARASHACAQRADGSIYCWGLNRGGELGNAATEDQQVPTLVNGAFSEIAVGDILIASRAADSSLWISGVQPDGSPSTLVPRHYADGTRSASMGGNHGCAIRTSDNSMFCAGNNSTGQLGDGTMVNNAQANVAGTWATVAAGNSATCATSMTNALSCWGLNGSGQLGIGSYTNALTPQAVSLASVAQVAMGDYFACAVTTSGELWCWGENLVGQLGTGSFAGANTPQRVGTDATWRKVATGNAHACALKLDNTLWCWGLGDEGETGPALGVHNSPQQMGGAEWQDVALGAYFTCALKLDGTRWCMGQNELGELGTGTAWRQQFTVIP